MPKVYIIILNYINWEDTIECLNSVELLDYENFEVVLIDNCSPGNSSDELNNYLNSRPALKCHFIQSPVNGGFAKGNNLGLEFALLQKDGDYFWLLNNDTVVQKDTLSHFVKEAELPENAHSGLFGSKLRYYDRPELIQAVGASYNKWLGIVKETGNLEIDKGQYDHVRKTDFIPGASMMISRKCLEEIGLMNDNLFLYFEELDWAQKAKSKGFELVLVPESMVFHKHGASIKSSGLMKKEKSRMSDFYFWRNKLLITSWYFPYCLPTVYLSYSLTAVNRILRKQSDRIPMLLKIMLRYKNIQFHEGRN